MLEQYQQYTLKRQNTGRYRQLPQPCKTPDTYHLDFSSNDYLGFSRRKELIDAAIQAGEQYGTGATGSRLLSGNNALFEKFEARIARDKDTESALLFNSGFQANITVLSSLLDSRVLKAKPLVFFDRLNHSSLYQALFLCGAELIRYQHMDMSHLARSLETFRQDPRPKFIVTETLFGMDGDIPPLHHIMELARKYNALVYLDEAHASGMVGKQGYGLSTTVNHDVPMVIMGTLGKALGCAGAWVACPQVIKDYLINKAEGFIYSTASSPMVTGAALKAWEMIPLQEEKRKTLFTMAETLREQLKQHGFHTGTSASHIIPIIIGHNDRLLQMHQKLKAAGIKVSLVRSPTVPQGSERLRLALNTTHTQQDVEYLLEVLLS